MELTVIFSVGTITYNSTGNFIDTLTASNSCDSIVTTNLIVENDINISVTISEPTLTANSSSSTYQWINCNVGNSPIPNETAQSFTATENGSYAVILTENNCSDTSDCYAITTIGIFEKNANNNLSIYPNPFDTEINLNINLSASSSIILELYDLQGKQMDTTIKSGLFQGNNIINYKPNVISKGVYMLKIITNDAVFVRRLVKN